VASTIGAALPFCSVSVIPLAAGLLGSGVPLAPVMAFRISSPLMDPTQFFIASGVLGIGFASAKMLSAGWHGDVERLWNHDTGSRRLGGRASRTPDQCYGGALLLRITV